MPPHDIATIQICQAAHANLFCETCWGDGVCPACDGLGEIPGHVCFECEGSGLCPECFPPGPF